MPATCHKCGQWVACPTCDGINNVVVEPVFTYNVRATPQAITVPPLVSVGPGGIGHECSVESYPKTSVKGESHEEG